MHRVVHNVEMDMVAEYLVDSSADRDPSYNCSATGTACAVASYDPAHRTVNASAVAEVRWSYGTPQFALRCVPYSSPSSSFLYVSEYKLLRETSGL